jgi:hypothetical protein
LSVDFRWFGGEHFFSYWQILAALDYQLAGYICGVFWHRLNRDIWDISDFAVRYLRICTRYAGSLIFTKT